MSINFKTSDPQRLLNTYKKAIKDGHVKTWSCDSDGDFTHTPTQWAGRGWLRPKVLAGVLRLTFLPKKTEVTTWEVYSIYHGRFIESMMEHCHELFDEASVPSHPTADDQITSKVA
jgi:hypothetical protein